MNEADAFGHGERRGVPAGAVVGGMIHATMRVALGDTAASSQQEDPAHWIIPEAEGAIEIPALRRPEPEEEEAT